ncbi:MAG: hypothetical protein Kow00109_08320 [Acidobacteriota bacterium]
MKRKWTHWLRFGPVAGVLLILLSAGAWAQTTELAGVVVDPAGAVVPGADVTLVNQATGNERAVVTDDEGRFRFPQLPPGNYTIRVELPGFKTLEQQNIRLLVDTPQNLTLRLELGEVSEVVTVSSSAERLMNQIDASLGNAFNTEQIIELPLNQRNVYQLLSLQPGVTEDGYVSGARSDQSNLTLDGIDVNEQQQGTAFESVLRVTPDSVQEFRVTTSTPGSSQGRSSGAQVSLVTKSGTNQFHGSLYEYHRNTVTAANDFFNNRIGLERPNLIRNLYGGTIGGPIKKDKVFFFYNYEGRKDRKQETVLQTVPLPHLGEGKMHYRNSAGELVELGPDEIAALFPATGGVNPAAAAALGEAASRYPANDQGAGDQLNTSGFRFNSPLPLDWNTHIARIDVVPNDKHSLFFRANYQWDHESDTRWLPDTPTPEFWTHPFGVAAGHTWTIRPTLINTFRYGLTRQAFTNSGDSDQNQIGFRFVFWPRDFSRTLSRTTPVHNIVNDTSWILGDHTLQFGINFRLIDNKRRTFAQAYDTAIMNPSFYAGSGAAVDAIEDYEPGLRDPIRTAFTALLGRYTQYSANGTYDIDGSLLPSGTPTLRNFATEEYEFYFEDTWQVNDQLTLNLGVRWGVNTPVYETSGFQVKPEPSLGEFFELRKASAKQGVPYNEPIVVDLAGPYYGRDGYYKQDWNNVSPRVSFAYSPQFDDGILRTLFGSKGESVIRGGFAVMYDRVGSAMAVSWDLNSTLGFVLSDEIAANTFNTTTRLGPLFTGWDQDIRSLPFMDIRPSISFPLMTPMDEDQRIEQSMDDTITTPINYNWNLSIGRELPGGLFIEASYVGRKARDLLATRDVMHLNNIVDPQSGIDWYTAAAELYRHRQANTPIDQVPNIPFFENLFPDVPSNWWWSWDPSLSATQNIFSFVSRDGWDILDWTFLQAELDDAGVVPNMFFHPQYAALSVWSTVARSDYHAFTFTMRERYGESLSFDLNYTWSKSMDNASGLQTETAYSSAALILNPLRPDDMYSVSDFDIQHIVNANWLWDLPFGKGRHWGADWSGFAEALLGGWKFNGVFRWNSGLPMASPYEASRWATNWNAPSWGVRIRDPQANPHKSGDHPNFWEDPKYAYNSYRDAMAGETGDRNVLRLDGFFQLDLGLYKTFRMPYNEDHRLTFRWEMFNATNTQILGAPTQSRDGWGLGTDPQLGTPAPSFGNINEIQGIPRVMQFGLRYDF